MGWRSPACEYAVLAGINPYHLQSELFNVPCARPGINRMLCSRPWGDNIWERIGHSFYLWCLTCIIYSIDTNTSYLPPPLSFCAHHHQDNAEDNRGLGWKEPSAWSKTWAPIWALPKTVWPLTSPLPSMQNRVMICTLPILHVIFLEDSDEIMVEKRYKI